MQLASRTTAKLLQNMPTGPAYDRTYVTTQVIDHQDALDSLHHWHASASSGRLKDAIAAAIPRVEQHLARARALQDALGTGLQVAAPAPPPRSDTTGMRVEMPAKGATP
jgi:predicted outer membrane protein